MVLRMGVKIGKDSAMTPSDKVLVDPQKFLPVDFCFFWENPKHSYGKSERLDEHVCEEVCMVVILLGESAKWLRCCHGCLNQ